MNENEILRVGSKAHALLVREFEARYRMSRDTQRNEREQSWRDAEDIYQMYVPEKDTDRQRKERRANGETDYTTIAVPYSYAMLLSAHTYYTSVFLSRSPILQVTGRHGEAQNAEMMVEALLDYQLNVGGNLPAFFVWLLDVGKYGHGVVGHYWCKEMVNTQQTVTRPRKFLGFDVPGTQETVRETISIPGYEGMKFFNIRPQDFFPDPRYPIWRFQEGEFCIQYDRVGWNELVRGAAQGRFFNLEEVRKHKGPSGVDMDQGNDRSPRPGFDITNYLGGESKNPSVVDLHYFHWELVPRDYGLGPSDKLERWVFTIANNRTVIGAQPLGMVHNKFPFDVITNEVDGYSLFTRGHLEILDPLNRTMEWLLNSHFFNVRAALNNQFIADPSRVNMKDLEDPLPGKMVRLKPAGYGQDVRTLLAQLPVGDVTRSHVNDLSLVGDLAQRVGGVNDGIMGVLSSGGRKTATEVRSANTYGVNRLKTSCEWFSACGFSPLVSKTVITTQQLYSGERKFRIVGDLAQWGERYLNIRPGDFDGFYDFVPVDGTLPVDRFAQANLWKELLGTMTKLPPVMMNYDIPKIFAFVAQLSGLKNITQFRLQVLPPGAPVPPGMVPAGNLPGQTANLNEPGQIPGMGPTG